MNLAGINLSDSVAYATGPLPSRHRCYSSGLCSFSAVFSGVLGAAVMAVSHPITGADRLEPRGFCRTPAAHLLPLVSNAWRGGREQGAAGSREMGLPCWPRSASFR